jgi:hypothetical protein
LVAVPSCEVTLTTKKEPGVIVSPLYSWPLLKSASILSVVVSKTAFEIASGTPGMFGTLKSNEVAPEPVNTESGNVTEPAST